MKSQESECIEFEKYVKCRNNVENWMTDIQNQMILTLRKLIKRGFDAY